MVRKHHVPSACHLTSLHPACSVATPQVGWFDAEENSSGRLTSGLASDATHVRGAVGDVAGLMLQSMTTFGLCYAIALYFDWRVALLITGETGFEQGQGRGLM